MISCSIAAVIIAGIAYKAFRDWLDSQKKQEAPVSVSVQPMTSDQQQRLDEITEDLRKVKMALGVRQISLK